MLRRRLRDHGFSLIELMVVVVVVAVLLAVAVPQMLGARQRAEDKAVRSNLRAALSLASVFAAANGGQYPTDTQLASEDSSMTFAAGTSWLTAPRHVSIWGGTTSFTAASLSSSGQQCLSVSTSSTAQPLWTTTSPPCRAAPGIVTTLAGSGTAAYANGTGAAASFNQPGALAFDSSGNLYVADTYNHRIPKITTTGVVTTVAGSGTAAFADGTGTGASFSYPFGLAVSPAGIVYVADTVNSAVRKIDTAGVVTTLADSTVLFTPFGIAIDAAGNLFIGDSGSSRIFKLTASGTLTWFAGSGSNGWADGTAFQARFRYPWGMAVDAQGNLWVADNWDHRVRRVSPDAVVTTWAGSGAATFADGIGPLAGLNAPMGLAVDSAGVLYLADAGNHRIRKIS